LSLRRTGRASAGVATGRRALNLPCPGEGYAGVAASARGLQALAAKAVLSLPAPETGRF